MRRTGLLCTRAAGPVQRAARAPPARPSSRLKREIKSCKLISRPEKNWKLQTRCTEKCKVCRNPIVITDPIPFKPVVPCIMLR